MPIQLALQFDDVPVTCEVQRRYHILAPVLAGRRSVAEQAQAFNLGYSTVARWLHQFRAQGMPGLFPGEDYTRGPYTPERVIVTLLYFKCCAPKASVRELARVVGSETGHSLHHQTVQALLERYFLWKHAEFTNHIRYPAPDDPLARRLEMVKLRQAGWSEKTIAHLLGCSRGTVIKWLRRWAQEAQQQQAEQRWMQDRSHVAHRLGWKTNLGTLHAVLQIQKKYGYAGWFRVKGYLEKDYGIFLGETTIKKIMRLNRKLHLAPTQPVVLRERESREGPAVSKHPFEYAFIDLRYLDAQPEDTQLYSCLLLDGYSRTILAGSLTAQQDLGMVLRVYYLALLQWGCWNVIVSEHGAQFESHAFQRVNHRLHIRQELYPKGHPWQNLIESQFGIQKRLGEYAWSRCRRIAEASELHRDLIRDHNRLPHWAHRQRNDGKRTPLEVLGPARGRETDAATLHRAFNQMVWRRKTDPQGFIHLGRWRVYVESGLPRTPVEVTDWDGLLRAEYQDYFVSQHHCEWDAQHHRPQQISHLHCFEHPYQSRQQPLFDAQWIREPVEEPHPASQSPKPGINACQLPLFLGPMLVR
jgi:transposase